MWTPTLIIVALLIEPSAAMAGTRAAAWRRPVIHRGASGTLPLVRPVPTLDQAMAFARVERKVSTHRSLVKQIALGRRALPIDALQQCVDTASTGSEAEECFLPGYQEADGWAM